MNKRNNAKFESKKHIPVYSELSIMKNGSNNIIKTSIYWSQIPDTLSYYPKATNYKWLGKTYSMNQLPVWSW